MMLNNLSMDSRITQPVRYSTTKNGSPMVNVSIANNRKDHTNFFDCVAFGKTADYIHNYAHVGQKMVFSGVLNHRIINGKDYYSITILSVDLNRDKGTSGNGTDGAIDDNIPKPKIHNNGQHFVPRPPHYDSDSEVKRTVNRALSKMPKNRGDR